MTVIQTTPRSELNIVAGVSSSLLHCLSLFPSVLVTPATFCTISEQIHRDIKTANAEPYTTDYDVIKCILTGENNDVSAQPCDFAKTWLFEVSIPFLPQTSHRAETLFFLLITLFESSHLGTLGPYFLLPSLFSDPLCVWSPSLCLPLTLFICSSSICLLAPPPPTLPPSLPPSLR